MTFLYPIGLLALIALPIILVLHLLNEQRRRARVPSLLLWRNVPRRLEGERSRQLPLTLLLLLHLLAAGLMGVALGRPQIPGAVTAEARHTAILIDTSTSMAADDGGASRFERAVARARALVSALGPGDRATLVAAGPQPRIIASGSAGDAAVLAAVLGQLEPGGTGTDLDAALTLAEAALDPQLARRVVVITDGALPAQAPRAVSAPVEWVQVGRERPNRAIVAFAARPWAGRVQVYARVANFGNEPFAGSVRLFAGETLLSTDPVSIAPGGETELTWTAPGDPGVLRATIEGRDALPLDDAAYAGVSRVRPLSALVVSARPAPLERALAAVPGVQVASVPPAEYAAAPAGPEADLTVFDGFLPPAWPPGATLAINPPPGNPLLEVTGDPLPLAGRELRLRGEVVEGLSLGGVSFGSARPLATPDWAEPLLSADEIPLILRGRHEGREVAIWTFDLAAGNLPTRLAFPLLVARTVRDLAPPPLPQSVQAGAAVTIRPDPRASEVVLTGPEGQQIRLPAAPAIALDALVRPGVYRVEERRGRALVLAGLVGV
ncbi:MAG TPA: BatA and WFA domain-containing protein, partial [Roseiflexaceae bacterium]|nr:BatA and WFA domain-containing protein [Roseiflexaceae bacterium]